MIPLKPEITQSEIELIQELISKNPSWGRTKLSIELCNLWGWLYQDGCPKEIACRDLLRKLDFKGLIKLPQKIKNTGLKPGSKNHIQLILHDNTEVFGNIKDIQVIFNLRYGYIGCDYFIVIVCKGGICSITAIYHIFCISSCKLE